MNNDITAAPRQRIFAIWVTSAERKKSANVLVRLPGNEEKS